MIGLLLDPERQEVQDTGAEHPVAGGAVLAPGCAEFISDRAGVAPVRGTSGSVPNSRRGARRLGVDDPDGPVEIEQRR
jgi:hypothetical protein